MGGNQPTAHEAVALVQAVGIQRMRLYGPDHSALEALRNTGIEVVLGVPNEHLHMLSTGQDGADQWVQEYVKNYQGVKFRYIVVGNGIAPLHAQTSEFAEFLLLPAMQYIQNAISASGLQGQIKVTTALDRSEILYHFSPPSAAEFRPYIRQFINGIISFLVNNGSAPLLVNLHPYLVISMSRKRFQGTWGNQLNGLSILDLTMLCSSRQRVWYETDHLGTQMCLMRWWTVYTLPWRRPTAGGGDANIKNAASHNNHLINHVRNNGTPKRPQKSVESYIYSLFDENRKYPEVNKHWGVFWNNKQAKYEIHFQG
ncbi:glucan endo-1,3-beta-glucosidase, acidic-like [Daucus carota subsp. sativus]|uniref:glucan endo-1,3-beta-glucosidase, acidic-like n=1 Tax=Daucus carota subsp. sativus TaxID=79200 RepID=UPI0007EF9684|nr:PREDICTED: glucan endo-1,3-beta-glucosidase, acidic-like [Daucus carota subsp. sativus]